MKKSFLFKVIPVLVLLTVISLTSCGQSSSQNSDLKQDREGNEISLPEKINTIISLGAANTEILEMLGLGNKIIAIDEYSADVEGLNENIIKMDLLALDAEVLVDMKPDVIFVSGMAKVDNEDPLKVVRSSGVAVAYIPVSSSIEGIKNDIMFLAEATNTKEKGEIMIAEMEAAIKEISDIGKTITDKKSVYFEIEPSPYLYSFGKGVFLNEMIELIGANNALGDQTGWIPVSEEILLSVNPDVILTNIGYIPEPVNEILSREGWEIIKAVNTQSVYYIDTNSSSRSTHNIVIALREMAKAIYPDKY